MSGGKRNAGPFLFLNGESRAPTSGSFVIRVPTGICSAHDLFEAYASEARFPWYFGRNWDALLDCLRDLAWIKNEYVVILHRDLPLSENEADLRNYIEVLVGAVLGWANYDSQGRIEPPSSMPRFVPHRLFVVFPSASQPQIERIANPYVSLVGSLPKRRI